MVINPRRLLRFIWTQAGVTPREIADVVDYPVPAIMWVVRLLASHHIVVTDGELTRDSQVRLNYLLAVAISQAERVGIELDLPLSR